MNEDGKRVIVVTHNMNLLCYTVNYLDYKVNNSVTVVFNISR